MIAPSDAGPASTLIAALPLLVLFVLLASGKVKGWVAALVSTIIAALVAFAYVGLPAELVLSSALLGAAFALFPIIWILFSALWIYHLCVVSGEFEKIKVMLGGMTDDRRLQALFIAFAFGAFLEGTAGFGVPVAITSAMLVGLGFPPLLAATLCLIANSSPVAFAAAGVPITVAAQVSGLDPLRISGFIALQLPLLSALMPLWLSVVLSGWRRSLEILPAILVGGLCLALSQFLVASTLGPWTTGIISGFVTVAALAILYRFWKPRRSWDFGDGVPVALRDGQRERVGLVAGLRAWSPYLLTSIAVLLWSSGTMKGLLKPFAISLPWPLLNSISAVAPGTVAKAAAPALFDFSILASAGTAIFLAGLLSTFILPNCGPRRALVALGKTFRDLRFTIPTVCLVMATAYIMNYSGMSTTIALALAGTGRFFPLFSPLLGWIGVVLTGSDTSSNALFCGLQRTTADHLGLDPALMVAGNTSGGVAGKMVSPQSLSVATASTGLAGREGSLFLAALPHSVAMVLLISLITFGLSLIFR